jgi:hypothetical protein
VTDLDPVRRPGEFVFVEADDATGAEAAVRESCARSVTEMDRDRAAARRPG